MHCLWKLSVKLLGITLSVYWLYWRKKRNAAPVIFTAANCIVLIGSNLVYFRTH